jgi:flagellar basal body-associated protein FliL
MRSSLRALLLAALALTVVPARADDDDAAKKKNEHKVTQSTSYLTLDPIYTTIVSGDHPVGLLMIGVGIDIPDAKLRGEADHSMPVIRDAFVRNLTAYAATQVRVWRQPDVTVIADRLQGVTDRALGRKGARVLLAQVAMRLTH